MLTTTFGLLLFSSSLFAMSHVPAELHTQILFTNSTPDTLTVHQAGDADAKLNTTEIAPLSTVVQAATKPENRGHTLTFDSNTNHWAEKPYLEYLDYTLTGNEHLQPISVYQEAFAPRSTAGDNSLLSPALQFQNLAHIVNN